MKRNVLRDFFVAHAVALILAFGVGVVSGLPQVLAERALGSDYRGIPYLYQDNDVTYLTRIHELYEGRTSLASPFLYEYKDGGKGLMPAVGEWLYVPFIKNIAFAKFLFPALFFLLLYALACVVFTAEPSLRRLGALTVASLGTLGYACIFPSEILTVFFGSVREPYLSIWTRLVHPVSGGLFLFGVLVCVRLITLERRWWALPGAVLLGLTTGYIFAFAVGATVTGIVLILLLLEKNWRSAYATLGVLCGALLINVPHFVGAFSRGVGGGSAEALKTGMLLTHEPLFGTVVFGAIALVGATLLFRWYQGEQFSIRSATAFSFVTLVSCAIAMNQQVITGRAVWPQHFIQYATPLIYLALVSVFLDITWVPRRVAFWLLVLGTVVSFVVGVVSLRTYTTVLDDYRTVNRYAAALEYLDAKKGPCVAQSVELDERMNPYITAFTHCDVYLTSYVFTGTPSERITHNFLVYLRLMGVTPSTVDTFLAEHRKKIWAVFFRDWRDIFHDTRDPWLLKQSDYAETERWLDATSVALASQYKKDYALGMKQLLEKYRLDYLLWDRDSGVTFTASAYPFLEPVFEEDDIVVYRVQ